ncbi:hypothetical protein ACLOJK_020329 [Asimina triloba]
MDSSTRGELSNSNSRDGRRVFLDSPLILSPVDMNERGSNDGVLMWWCGYILSKEVLSGNLLSERLKHAARAVPELPPSRVLVPDARFFAVRQSKLAKTTSKARQLQRRGTPVQAAGASSFRRGPLKAFLSDGPRDKRSESLEHVPCCCVCVVKVGVVGLGISGRAAARLALARGASVIAIDSNKHLIPLERDHPVFAGQINLRTVLGHCDGKILEDADRVVVSPGVPPENYDLSRLMRSGGHVMSELDFAAEVLSDDVKILAVSGTNGKSTVTTFAGQMLHHLGIRAFIGGNLGNPLSNSAIQCLESSSSKDMFQVAVVEVSSYQMEIPSNHFCPSVAVVLNLTPDHLERHKTMHMYAQTKCRLFSRMKDCKLAILPAGNQHLMGAFNDYMEKCNVGWIGDLPGIKSQLTVMCFVTKMDMEAKVANLTIPTIGLVTKVQLGALKTIGDHNCYNAAVAAISILGLNVGIKTDSINAAVEKLNTPPHRMQIVCRDTQGIMWVNDSKATNVDATYAALKGLKEKRSVVLLGGVAKDSRLLIQKILNDFGLSIPCVHATDLEDAVKVGRSMARRGDTILLSPGCASFDEFRNFEHRGNVFRELALSSSQK